MGVREDVFIKDHMPGDLIARGGLIITHVTFVCGTISNEDTGLRSKINFVSIVRSEKRKAKTAKDF